MTDFLKQNLQVYFIENPDDAQKIAEQVLINKGYDEKYGARPLRRAIQTLVEDSLAEEILDGKIRRRSHVMITAESPEAEKLEFIRLPRIRKTEKSSQSKTAGKKASGKKTEKKALPAKK